MISEIDHSKVVAFVQKIARQINANVIQKLNVVIKVEKGTTKQNNCKCMENDDTGGALTLAQTLRSRGLRSFP